MSSEKKSESISNEEIEHISGVSVSMVYKPGLFARYIVMDPRGIIQCRCWTKGDAFDEAKKYSLNSQGYCRGAVRELSTSEYDLLVSQERIQKDV